jgi:hypothetical protein
LVFVICEVVHIVYFRPVDPVVTSETCDAIVSSAFRLCPTVTLSPEMIQEVGGGQSLQTEQSEQPPFLRLAWDGQGITTHLLEVIRSLNEMINSK